jgi:DNA-binding MltR family transcriptional regulator
MPSKLPPDWSKPVDEEGTDRATIIAGMLMRESDRGCAIFGAGILHDDLEALLRTIFRDEGTIVKKVINPLFQGYAPLATFSSRIQLCYAMKLISHTNYQRLEAVRRIRNDFAHEAGPINFEDPRCTQRLQLLISEQYLRQN